MGRGRGLGSIAAAGAGRREPRLRHNADGLVIEPGPVMYHVTTPAGRTGILADGLVPSSPTINTPGSPNPEGVYMFATMGDMLSHPIYGDCMGPDGEDPAIFAVRTSGLALLPDPDWVTDEFPYPNTAWYTPSAIPVEGVALIERSSYDVWSGLNPDPFTGQPFS